jgi:hypothetical protein
VLLIVTLAHVGLIVAMLLWPVPRSRERRSVIETPALVLLETKSSPMNAPRIDVHIESPAANPRSITTVPLPSLRLDDNAVTLSPTEQPRPPIDWEHESALAVASSTAHEAKERSYRDLSALTPEQLDWVKRNHLEPAPGFHWDRNSRRDMLRHGIIKLNDYCVLIVVMPFCNFGGKIQYDGDLFKNMRDPKPMD